MKIRRILVELMVARCPESEVLRDLARDVTHSTTLLPLSHQYAIIAVIRIIDGFPAVLGLQLRQNLRRAKNVPKVHSGTNKVRPFSPKPRLNARAKSPNPRADSFDFEMSLSFSYSMYVFRYASHLLVSLYVLDSFI